MNVTCRCGTVLGEYAGPVVPGALILCELFTFPDGRRPMAYEQAIVECPGCGMFINIEHYLMAELPHDQ